MKIDELVERLENPMVKLLVQLTVNSKVEKKVSVMA